MQQPRKTVRLFLGFLLIVLLLSGPLASTAEAAIKGCRSDPVVILSDGTVLDVQAGIDTYVQNVREIHYVVHGPSGVKLVAVLTTPTLGFQGKETFTYYDDAGPREYITETLVQTIEPQVSVTSYTTFASALLNDTRLLSLQYKPITGYNNQILRAVLQR